MPRLIAGLTLIAVLALAGCRAAPIYNPTDVAFAVPPTSVVNVLTLDDYKNAIVRGGATRGWVFTEAAPGHLVGDVTVRGKHAVSVDVYFDTESFSISHKASRNLNYNAARGEIHPSYNSWVTFLQNEIQAEVTRMKAS